MSSHEGKEGLRYGKRSAISQSIGGHDYMAIMRCYGPFQDLRSQSIQIMTPIRNNKNTIIIMIVIQSIA